MTLGEQLGPLLPFLRRYASALTGSYEAGDQIVRLTLGKITENPASFPKNVTAKIGLYRAFDVVLESLPSIPVGRHPDSESSVRRQLSLMPVLPRKALLLRALEQVTVEDTAYILGIDRVSAEAHIEDGVLRLNNPTGTTAIIAIRSVLETEHLKRIIKNTEHTIVDVVYSADELVRSALRRTTRSNNMRN